MGVEVPVCRLSDLEEKKPFAVDCNGLEVGVIWTGERVLAYENKCPHRGGPVCLGSVFGRIRVQLDANQAAVREYVAENEDCLVCPWHGFEFDLESGICTADSSLQLRKVEAFVRDETVYVNVEQHQDVQAR